MSIALNFEEKGFLNNLHDLKIGGPAYFSELSNLSPEGHDKELNIALELNILKINKL